MARTRQRLKPKDMRRNLKKIRNQAAATLTSVTTRAMAQRHMSDTVFLTTELLERILVKLPMKDLLLAQRVSKKFRNVINGSKTLRQALFFISAEPESY